MIMSCFDGGGMQQRGLPWLLFHCCSPMFGPRKLGMGSMGCIRAPLRWFWGCSTENFSITQDLCHAR